MLGRKDYTRAEFDNARSAIDRQLAAWRALVATATDPKTTAKLDAFEPLFMNNLTLALDRYFVHRIRMVTGKDGNPLNEVELIVESLLDHGGVLRANNVIKLHPDESVTKIQFGERIALTADVFERLADAFFAELDRKFVA